MFNPEKLLGGLLRSSVRGRKGGLGGLVSGGVALGALGVAMEAVNHFMNKPQEGPPSAATGTPPPPSGSAAPTGAAPPPPPPSGTSAGSAQPPPPGSGGPPAAPPLATAPTESTGEQNAVLLIRAMIAAANADGVIDQIERNNILEKLKSVDLSPEEHEFIFRELLSPADLDAIAGRVSTPELARQVYAVSLMAIEVDTQQERAYMETLARRLELGADAVAEIHRSIDTV